MSGFSFLIAAATGVVVLAVIIGMIVRRRARGEAPLERATDTKRDAKRADAPSQSSRLGKSIHIEGNLTFSEALTIDGTFAGALTSDSSTLTTTAGSRIDGTLAVHHVILGGAVHAEVKAQRVELKATAQLDGNVQCDTITIADGARFDGNVKMDRASEHAGGAPRAHARAASE
ncbi:MAG TPA: polymer-forming cytoskeletal protein [Thermoanaerobaculia bacterium]|nr:polymer-forming cytoskeletal protein [Thermoanaerobaculia bacterium]